MFEIEKLSRAFPSNVQKVVAASTICAHDLAPHSVKVVTCAIEASLLYSTNLVSSKSIETM